MIPLLGPDDPLPAASRALRYPNGLLAAGGGLSLRRLLDAYRRGVFPWFNEGDPVLWWCPDPRLVLPTDGMVIRRSLRKRLKRADYTVSADTAFSRVIHACAAPRQDDAGTWLTPEMIAAYERLHAAGYAHAIEVWMDGALAGGLYGVAMGRMFFGESMFSFRPDGSKIALAYLTTQLRRWRFPLIDCQMPTDHLMSLGAIAMPRRQFLAATTSLAGDLVPPPGRWTFDADLRAAVLECPAGAGGE